jgi:hypothetical protein
MQLATSAPAALAPPGTKIFLGLSGMERDVARIEAQLAGLQDELAGVLEGLEDAADLPSLLAELRSLHRRFEAALAARDALVESIHAEQAILVQFDSSGVLDARHDYRALEELEARLTADFGDPLAVIGAAIDEAREMAAAHGSARQDF